MDLCRLADCIERTHRRWTIQKGLQSQGWGYVCWVSPCLFILSQEAFPHTPRLPPHQYSTSTPPQPQPQPQRAAPAQAPASRSWCGTNTRAADCNPAATSSCCGGRGVKGVAKFGPEAVIFAREAVKHGVPEDAILIEPEAVRQKTNKTHKSIYNRLGNVALRRRSVLPLQHPA